MANDNVRSAGAATQKVDNHSTSLPEGHCTRRRLCVAALVLWATGLGACHPNENIVPTEGAPVSKDKKEVVSFDVGLFVYLDYPIFDVYLNGIDIGVGGPYSGLNGGARGLMTGVAVPLGPQVITWRDAGTGEKFRAVNQPVLTRADKKFTYLGVYIYPDNTVELIPSEFWPETSERGVALWQQWRKNNGQ